MEKKYSLTLDKEFIQYCKLNNIEDIEGKANEVFKQGFTILKYGEKPNIKTLDDLKKETIKKWEDAGFLDQSNLPFPHAIKVFAKTTPNTPEPPPTKMIKEGEKPVVKVTPKKDLYDE